MELVLDGREEDADGVPEAVHEGVDEEGHREDYPSIVERKILRR